MKIFVEDYDVEVEFPDDTPQSEIQRVLADSFPARQGGFERVAESVKGVFTGTGSVDAPFVENLGRDVAKNVGGAIKTVYENQPIGIVGRKLFEAIKERYGKDGALAPKKTILERGKDFAKEMVVETGRMAGQGLGLYNKRTGKWIGDDPVQNPEEYSKATLDELLRNLRENYYTEPMSSTLGAVTAASPFFGIGGKAPKVTKKSGPPLKPTKELLEQIGSESQESRIVEAYGGSGADIVPKPEMIDLSAPAPTMPHDTSSYQRGSFSINPTVNAVYEQMKNTGRITEANPPWAVKYFEGFFPGMTKSVKSIFAFPKTIADKSPKFNEIYERGVFLFKDRDSFVASMRDILDPYYTLKDRTKVDSALINARYMGEKFKPTEINLKALGLNDAEVTAYQAVRKAMNKGLHEYRMQLLEEAQMIPDVNKRAAYVAAVNEQTRKLWVSNYVPFSRFGKKYMAVLDANDNLVSFQMFKNNKEMKAAAVKLGLNNNLKIKTGDVLKTNRAMFENMPVEILSILKNLDEGAGVELSRIMAKYVGGFPEHLLHAKKTPGFATDLGRSLADYAVGMGNYLAHRGARTDFMKMMEGIDPKLESGLYGYASRYINYLQTVTPEGSSLRNFLFHYYLGGNIKSATINLTQTLTTSYPVAARYTKIPEYYVMKGIKEAFNYLRSGGKIADKQRAAAIKLAMDRGILSEKMMREMSGRAYGGKPGAKAIENITDVTSYVFDRAERANRYVAFNIGYDLAKKQGYEFYKAIKFAEDFVDQTQFRYGKTNRPEIARGVTAPLFTFRLFMGNYLKLLKDAVVDKQFGQVARMLGTMGALGGAYGIPGAKEIDQALTIAGVDTKSVVRKYFNNSDIADVFMHGLPVLSGGNISGAIGIGELLPDVERGPAVALARGVGGVMTDIPMRVNRSIAMMKDYDHPYRAVEAIMPEALRNAMVAGRWVKEGAVRSPTLEPVVPNISKRDTVLKGLGFQPAKVTAAYERENSETLLKEHARKYSKDLNFRLAKALFEGDDEKLKKLLEGVIEHNEKNPVERMISPDTEAIQKHLIGMILPEAREIREMPKKARPKYLEIQELYEEEGEE